MKYLILAALLSFSVSFSSEKIEDCTFCRTSTEIANADPMPDANDGLGCITDSECEGIEVPCNDEDCPPDTEHDGTLYS